MVNEKSPGLWKKAAEGLGKIDVQKYLTIDERELKIYETADGTLFNTEVIDKYAIFTSYRFVQFHEY
jgi:hypothetical protein